MENFMKIVGFVRDPCIDLDGPIFVSCRGIDLDEFPLRFLWDFLAPAMFRARPPPKYSDGDIVAFFMEVSVQSKVLAGKSISGNARIDDVKANLDNDERAIWQDLCPTPEKFNLLCGRMRLHELGIDLYNSGTCIKQTSPKPTIRLYSCPTNAPSKRMIEEAEKAEEALRKAEQEPEKETYVQVDYTRMFRLEQPLHRPGKKFPGVKSLSDQDLAELLRFALIYICVTRKETNEKFEPSQIKMSEFIRFLGGEDVYLHRRCFRNPDAYSRFTFSKSHEDMGRFSRTPEWLRIRLTTVTEDDVELANKFERIEELVRSTLCLFWASEDKARLEIEYIKKRLDLHPASYMDTLVDFSDGDLQLDFTEGVPSIKLADDIYTRSE